MRIQKLKESFTLLDALIFVVVILLGTIIGVASVWLSGELVFQAICAMLLLYIILQRHEVILIGMLVATSSILFENQLPSISLGISLQIPDMLLLGAFALFALRWLVEPDFKIIRTPLDWLVLMFLTVTLLSTFLAFRDSSVEIEPVRRGIRTFSYYSAFFLVTNLVRDRKQLSFLLKGIFLLAIIVSGAMIIQFLIGSSVKIIPGSVYTMGAEESSVAGITRIIPPGFSVVLIAFISVMCTLIFAGFRAAGGWGKVFQVAILGLALLVTFLRSYWASIIIVFAFLAILLRWNERKKLLSWGVIFSLIAGIVILFSLAFPETGVKDLLDASVGRILTLLDAGTFQGQDYSVTWRKIENSYALTSISTHPWLGMGIGFKYRPWDFRLDGPQPNPIPTDMRRFIHNGHFWILLQSGLFGYLSFLGLSIAFLVRGFSNWQLISDIQMRGIVLGFTLFYCVILIASVSNSVYMNPTWTPVIAIAMGVNELIIKNFKDDEETS